MLQRKRWNRVMKKILVNLASDLLWNFLFDIFCLFLNLSLPTLQYFPITPLIQSAFQMLSGFACGNPDFQFKHQGMRNAQLMITCEELYWNNLFSITLKIYRGIEEIIEHSVLTFRHLSHFFLSWIHSLCNFNKKRDWVLIALRTTLLQQSKMDFHLCCHSFQCFFDKINNRTSYFFSS